MPLSDSVKGNFIRVGNIVSLLLLFVANAISLKSDPSLLDIYRKHITYFSPSLTFLGIFWVVLYVLLFGFVSYAQFSNVFIIQRLVTSTVGSLLIISNLLMCGCLLFWMLEKFILSELFMFLGLLVVHRFHHNIIVHFSPTSHPSLQATKIVALVNTPFSMYAAFTLIGVVYNGFIAFTNDDEIFALAAIACAWLLAVIGMAWTVTGILSDGRRDGVLGAAIAWTLLGVAVQQQEIIKYLSVQCTVLSITLIVIILVIRINHGGSLSEAVKCQRNITVEQCEPLLQEEEVEC